MRIIVKSPPADHKWQSPCVGRVHGWSSVHMRVRCPTLCPDCHSSTHVTVVLILKHNMSSSVIRVEWDRLSGIRKQFHHYTPKNRLSSRAYMSAIHLPVRSACLAAWRRMCAFYRNKTGVSTRPSHYRPTRPCTTLANASPHRQSSSDQNAWNDCRCASFRTHHRLRCCLPSTWMHAFLIYTNKWRIMGFYFYRILIKGRFLKFPTNVFQFRAIIMPPVFCVVFVWPVLFRRTYTVSPSATADPSARPCSRACFCADWCSHLIVSN